MPIGNCDVCGLAVREDNIGQQTAETLLCLNCAHAARRRFFRFDPPAPLARPRTTQAADGVIATFGPAVQVYAGPEDNPADDVQPTQEDWDFYERARDPLDDVPDVPDVADPPGGEG